MNLFDKMFTPILLYGSEIWGYEYSHVIEQVQLEYCKKILGVRGNTINCADLGECGRRPLAVHYMCKCVKYWLKPIQMPVNRYPHVCYNMLMRVGRSHGQNMLKCYCTNTALDRFGYRKVLVMKQCFLLNF